MMHPPLVDSALDYYVSSESNAQSFALGIHQRFFLVIGLKSVVSVVNHLLGLPCVATSVCVCTLVMPRTERKYWVSDVYQDNCCKLGVNEYCVLVIGDLKICCVS